MLFDQTGQGWDFYALGMIWLILTKAKSQRPDHGVTGVWNRTERNNFRSVLIVEVTVLLTVTYTAHKASGPQTV